MRNYIYLILILTSCTSQKGPEKFSYDDSYYTTYANVETVPVNSGQNDDAADDPAIWYNAQNPYGSLIVGTDKKAGLYVYNLNGQVVHFHETGRVNNVDLRTITKPTDSSRIVLVAASNRSHNGMSILLLDTLSGQLQEIPNRITPSVDEVYGFALYQPEGTGELFAFINGKDGQVEQWCLMVSDTLVEADKLRTLLVPSQPEGMVADDQTGILYVGEEAAGVWYFQAHPDSSTKGYFIESTSTEHQHFEADIEGVAIYKNKDKNILVVSVQGNYSYALFDINNQFAHLGSFIIKDGLVDAVEETDGLEVLSLPIGEKYPEGLLIVQDGFNYDGDSLRSQNFKIVDWRQVSKGMGD